MTSLPWCVSMLVVLAAGCGASLSPTQRAARDEGTRYLSARAGATFGRCPPERVRVRGGPETFTVTACDLSVDVHCTWGAGEAFCTAAPLAEAARTARARPTTTPTDDAPRARPTSAHDAPPSIAEGAAFRQDDAGVLRFDAVAGYLELHARASAAHPESVLVTATVTAGEGPACDHILTFTAAGEPVAFAPDRREGSTSHHVIPADTFASFGERVPLRVTVCDQTLAFGHRELRALRAFIAADAGLPAQP